MVLKIIHILNIDNFFPEMCELTMPLIQEYAANIGAEINVITPCALYLRHECRSLTAQGVTETKEEKLAKARRIINGFNWKNTAM